MTARAGKDWRARRCRAACPSKERRSDAGHDGRRVGWAMGAVSLLIIVVLVLLAAALINISCTLMEDIRRVRLAAAHADYIGLDLPAGGSFRL